MNNSQIGRVKLGRFAAVAVPATAASLGLGLAVLQGMATAALASTDGFRVDSTQITSPNVAVALNGVSVSNRTGTPSDKAAAVALVNDSKLKDLCLRAATPVGGLLSTVSGVDGLGLKIQSAAVDGADTNSTVDEPEYIALGNIKLNAKQVSTNADFGNTTVGTDAGAIDDTSTAATTDKLGKQGEFALTGGTKSATATASDPNLTNTSKLNAVAADAYELNLSGLALQNLIIKPVPLTSTDGVFVNGVATNYPGSSSTSAFKC